MIAGLALWMACATPEPPPAPTARRYRLDDAGPPEQWRDGDALAWFEGRRLWRDGEERKAVRRWPSMGDVLTPCVGDPLLVPPARDPAGFRKLDWGDEVWWRVELSGTNRCGLSGVLRLNAGQDRVDPAGLVADGKSWFEGGQEAARALLRAELRAEALRQWPGLALPERILVIHRLERDPHPDAEATLRALEALGDENAVDIQHALARRAAGVSGE